MIIHQCTVSNISWLASFKIFETWCLGSVLSPGSPIFSTHMSIENIGERGDEASVLVLSSTNVIVCILVKYHKATFFCVSFIYVNYAS